MKKLLLSLVVLFALSITTSCTPESIAEDDTEIYNVDRTKIRKPGDQTGG